MTCQPKGLPPKQKYIADSALKCLRTVAKHYGKVVPFAAAYQLTIRLDGAPSAQNQQFRLTGEVEKHLLNHLQPQRTYWVYLTALSHTGTEIVTVEYAFKSKAVEKWLNAIKYQPVGR